jgi:3-oxoadipate enol-lactonase
VYSETQGTGPAVVLMHAGLLDGRMWDEQYALLGDAGYRVVRYDARGHGRSGALTEGYAHHEDLRELLDELSIDRATLVGLSLGARTAIDFALLHPDRVDALVLAAPGMSGMTFDDPFIIEHGDKAIAAAGEGDLPGFIEEFARQWVDGPHRAPADVDPAIRARCLTMATETVAGHPTWLPPREVGAADRLGELRVPVLTMVGDLDSADIVRVVDRLALLPGARRVVVPGAGHMINLERPEAFNRELLAFLSRRSPGGA